MSLWMVILVLLGVVKLPIAALMLWLPFRNDEAMRAGGASGSSDEDGGSPALPAGPTDPRPRDPRRPRPRPPGPGTCKHRPARRRGAHGPAPASPPRVRTPARRRGSPVAG